MRLRPINTIGNILLGGQAVHLDGPVPVKALHIAYAVANDVGDDTDFTDIIGQTLVSITGSKKPTGDRVNLIRPQSLVSFVDAFGGTSRTVSATGGAALHVITIPFGMENDDNCLFIRYGQTLNVYPPAFDPTDVTAAQCTVYAEPDLARVNRYNLRYIETTIPLGGLVRFPIESHRSGLAALIISESSTGAANNPTSVALMRGDERLNWGDWDDFRGVSYSALRVEGDMVFDDVVMDLTSRGKALWTGFGGGLDLELMNGAGNVVVTQVLMDRHVGGALQESLAYRAAQVIEVSDSFDSAGTPYEIKHALVPPPSINPGIEAPHLPIPKAPEQAEFPSSPPHTTLPVVPQGRVLKRLI